jgi:hypothetical protein
LRGGAVLSLTFVNIGRLRNPNLVEEAIIR